MTRREALGAIGRSAGLMVTAPGLALAQTAIPRTTPPASAPARPTPAALSGADVAAIAELIMLEDQRKFDEPVLARLLQSPHSEIRRRTAVAIGRIVNPRGRAMLVTARTDRDPEVVATAAFSAGQLKDPDAVPWLDSVLMAPASSPGLAREAACALGKIRIPESRAALARYLTTTPATAAVQPVVGEALLAIGRFMPSDDLGPIVKWATATSVEVRWRAAWALFRPRDPAAAPHLRRLADDPSGDVRFWAIRGLAPQVGRGATSPPDPGAATRLRAAVRDLDRRVRTEAIRALALFDDDASVAAVLQALASPDTWLSVSAAEGLARLQSRADVIVPRLVEAASPARPVALRVTVLAALTALAPNRAVDVAAALARHESLVARLAAGQALSRLDAAGRSQLDALLSDPSLANVAPWGRGGGVTREALPARTPADYRQLAERWVARDYNGLAKPQAVLETRRGPIRVELYAGDAPLGTDYFRRVVESGEIVGTEFGRVVPNFVAQQRPIRDDVTLRDEVNRRGLTRGTLSWASAGLDSGRPGYTLGCTPQPHNEGDFTALGRVVAGMQVVDRLELGDRITAARMI